MPTTRKRNFAQIAKERIVVSCDVGTTYSGLSTLPSVPSYFTNQLVRVAVAYHPDADRADQIAVLKDWPGGNGETSEKVPTELVYEEGSEVPTWGYEIPAGEDRFTCIKLLLDENKVLPSWVSREELVKQLEEVGKTPVEAVTDYLIQMNGCVREQLNRQLTKDYVDAAEIEYVMTVPAVWSDAAKDATMTAARNAGMSGSLKLISEPEAAAIFTLSTLKGVKLQVGDVFIVCDAGGGTVDLITYEIQHTDPLRFREVVPGQGGLCGGVFIDLAFENYLKQRFGKREFAKMCREKPMMLPTALSYFEDKVKRKFNPDETGKVTFKVPVPGMPDDSSFGVKDGFILLTTKVVESFFVPQVTKTLALIQSQRDQGADAGKDPKGIILVGGLGKSKYLYHRIQEHFGKNTDDSQADEELFVPPTRNAGASKPAFLIIQPVEAWTAIMRGAVVSGIAGYDMVTSRKAVRHYGVPFDDNFSSCKHRPESKFWDKLDECYRAKNQMDWFIKKGQEVKSGEPILVAFHRCHTDEDFPGAIKETLYCCDEDDAPTELDDDDLIYPLCELVVDTDRKIIPAKSWDKDTSSVGKNFKRLTYHLGMYVDSGRIHFDFRIKNTIRGSVDTRFE
ncbi:Heat shock protein 12B [Elsinoe australis]|uniref:Heat shock protein 12B n=1 Tax=Elsinoe australis TaxID=40998 RepID=A0A2P7YW68_9PEZI|nr:Heat shock protein 12B [Elsinoe australis]